MTAVLLIVTATAAVVSMASGLWGMLTRPQGQRGAYDVVQRAALYTLACVSILVEGTP
jgi:hypothetical protein